VILNLSADAHPTNLRAPAEDYGLSIPSRQPLSIFHPPRG
jgi:hypothetical protein